MKLLLTNDDGIDAPGLQALFEAVHGHGEPIILAPTGALSGCSHRVTTDQPFRVENRGEGRFAVAGTPADCVRVGLHQFAQGLTCVLSGINAGGNLGADVHHSGTVAAAREAVLHGVPAIAVSHYQRRGLVVDWARAVRWIAPLLAELLHQPWTPGTFWNINLPHLDAADGPPPIVHCPLDPTPLPLSFREEEGLLRYNGNYHERRRVRDADVDVCFRGQIAVTRISLL